MGAKQSATSRRKPTTSDGFFGRNRHTGSYRYHKRVPQINGVAIGKLIREFCGNEGRHRVLDDEGKETLAFLRAANSFIHDALDDGADLRNAAFIVRIPGREFVIQAGNGDWEYDFCQEADGEIYGRCVRKPLVRYLWDKVMQIVVRVGPAVVGGALKAAFPFPALTWQ